MRKKHGARKYIVTAMVGLALAMAVMGIRGGYGATDQALLLQALCDACFVAGILLVCVGLLIFVAGDGMFDMLGYGVRKLLRLVLPQEKQDQFPKTFYDYREMKHGGGKAPFGYLLLVGLGYILLAGVLLAMYIAAAG